jgi:hypothetical protein
MKDIRDTLFGVVEMEYLYRNVGKGSVTFQEWDDHVRYYRGRVTGKVLLFTSTDYLPSFYCIGSAGSRSLIGSVTTNATRNDIIFRNYTDAKDFFDWLRNRVLSGKNGGKPIQLATSELITFEGRDLKASDFSGNNPLKVQQYFRKD